MSDVNSLDANQQRFDRVVAAVADHLHAEEIDEIKMFLHHGEPELALEGLVTCINRSDFDPPSVVRKDLGDLIQNYGLNNLSIKESS